jgi:hypothetical protein
VYAATAIVLDEPKAAALYFDYVLPLDLYSEFVPEPIASTLGKDTVTSIIEGTRSRYSFTVLPDRLLERVETLAPPVLLNDERLRKEVTLLLMFVLGSNDRAVAGLQALKAVLDLFPEGSLSAFGKLARAGNREEDTVSLVLSNLKLVDAERLSWEHILEVRRDAKSMAKLRRLRLLFHENYSGKPSSYIEDDLLRRVDEYDETVKEWRLDTVEQSLEMICSSKSLAATAAAAIAAGLFGGMTLTAAAAVSSGFEVGKIGLSIWKKRRELVKFKNQNDVSYLVEQR